MAERNPYAMDPNIAAGFSSLSRALLGSAQDDASIAQANLANTRGELVSAQTETENALRDHRANEILSTIMLRDAQANTSGQQGLLYGAQATGQNIQNRDMKGRLGAFEALSSDPAMMNRVSEMLGVEGVDASSLVRALFDLDSNSQQMQSALASIGSDADLQTARTIQLDPKSSNSDILAAMAIADPATYASMMNNTADNRRSVYNNAANNTQSGLNNAANNTQSGLNNAANNTQSGVNNAANNTQSGLNNAATNTQSGLNNAATNTQSGLNVVNDPSKTVTWTSTLSDKASEEILNVLPDIYRGPAGLDTQIVDILTQAVSEAFTDASSPTYKNYKSSVNIAKAALRETFEGQQSVVINPQGARNEFSIPAFLMNDFVEVRNSTPDGDANGRNAIISELQEYNFNELQISEIIKKIYTMPREDIS